jgi:phosphatidylserine/phosphatidylglycerophosphate/cardiolipin synthase-like enzyme
MKFLNTSGLNYHIEELIKNSEKYLILISPYLKLNEKIKYFLSEKSQNGVVIKIIYGKKKEIQDLNFFNSLKNTETLYLDNLHSKLYFNEKEAILTSLNLYDFSQINNYEMGIFFSKETETELFSQMLDEVQQIAKTAKKTNFEQETKHKKNTQDTIKYSKLTTSKFAKELKISTKELIQNLTKFGYLKIENNKEVLTQKAKISGAEVKTGKFGEYILWDTKNINFDNNFQNKIENVFRAIFE